MATQSATFTFALPEDTDSNQLLIYNSSTKEGTYTLVSTVSYSYGDTTYELTTLDDTKWYKIKFNNSTDSQAGPLSDPVFGGDFSNAAPFLAVSTGTDGANFATVDDVYEYSTFTPSQVSRSRVSAALRRARAVIDLRTASLDIDRFDACFDTEISRKKFNAQLRILKEAEMNLAIGHMYRGLCDDQVIRSITDDTAEKPAISLGGTSIGSGVGALNTEHMAVLSALADRYLAIGSAMLAALQPSSVKLIGHDDDQLSARRFKYPWEV